MTFLFHASLTVWALLGVAILVIMVPTLVESARKRDWEILSLATVVTVFDLGALALLLLLLSDLGVLP